MKKSCLIILVVCSFAGCKKSSEQQGGNTTPIEVIPQPQAPSKPVVRSSLQMSFTGVTTVAVQKPAGAATGDLLIMVMAKDGSQLSMPQKEEGWVRIVSKKYGSGTPLIRAWWKKISNEDSSAYVFKTGSAANSGRVDLICIKDWKGSAPTAVSSTHSGNTSFQTPAIPAISSSGGDLLLTSVAIAAASGLENVTWDSIPGLVTTTTLSTPKVTMSTFSKNNLATTAPQSAMGYTLTASGMTTSRVAAVLSFMIPAASNRPVIRVYRGGAARTVDGAGNSFYLSHENLVDILADPSEGYDVRSIGENEVDKITTENLNTAALYIQPGGPTINVGWPFIAPQKTLIRNYIDNGGKYLGVCLGAYFFRNFYDGQSFELLPAGNFAYTYSSLTGSTYNGDGADLVNLNLKAPWGGGTRTLTIVGGSYFYCPGQVPDLETLATYIQPNNTEPRAAIRFSFNPNNDSKKGWVIGIGPHPEATGWGGITDPDGSDPDLIKKSVSDLLSR